MLRNPPFAAILLILSLALAACGPHLEVKTKFLFWAIIWVFLSFIAASIANDGGLSWLGFLLLSLALSPVIGIIVVLAVSTIQQELHLRQQEIEAKQVQAGELKRCPPCAELVKAQAAVCRYCGHEF